MKNKHQAQRRQNTLKIPPNPMISHNTINNVGYRDTLNRVTDVLNLLTELDLSKGLSDETENGIFWVQLMVIDSVKYVSRALEETDRENTEDG